MAAQSRPFTASGQIEVADQSDEFWGLVYTGFTAVTVHDGTDNTGPVLLAGGAGPLSLLSNFPIKAAHGLYVEAAGVGNGSVLV